MLNPDKPRPFQVSQVRRAPAGLTDGVHPQDSEQQVVAFLEEQLAAQHADQSGGREGP